MSNIRKVLNTTNSQQEPATINADPSENSSSETTGLDNTVDQDKKDVDVAKIQSECYTR